MATDERIMDKKPALRLFYPAGGRFGYLTATTSMANPAFMDGSPSKTSTEDAGGCTGSKKSPRTFRTCVAIPMACAHAAVVGAVATGLCICWHHLAGCLVRHRVVVGCRFRFCHRRSWLQATRGR